LPVSLKSRLPEIALELNARALAGLEAGAELIAEGARQRVPVESGALRDSIHVDTTKGEVSVVAGDRTAFYGHMVEFGTTHSPAEPFLVPAAEAAKVEVAAAVTTALREL
jgi:HK97 gp10 family phage protein